MGANGNYIGTAISKLTMLTQHNYAITAEDVVSIISGRFLIMRADDDAVDEQERARNAFLNVHSSQDDIVKILRKFGTTNRRLTSVGTANNSIDCGL